MGRGITAAYGKYPIVDYRHDLGRDPCAAELEATV